MKEKLKGLIKYMIVNEDNNFFYKRGGYWMKYENCWVGDPMKGKMYSKISTARTQVTEMKKEFPDKPIANIIKLFVSGYQFINEEDRVNITLSNKEIQNHKDEVRNRDNAIKIAQKELEDAKRKLKEAKELSDMIKRGVKII